MTKAPLFSQVRGYADGIERQIRATVSSRYQRRRLVNFFHRFDDSYRDAEEALFLSDPGRYSHKAGSSSINQDLLATRLPGRLVVRQVLKTLAHWAFRIAGSLQSSAVDRTAYTRLRRCYVEDVEALFGTDAELLRLIYPFPLSVARQIRYVRLLRNEGKSYTLAGLPYAFSELLTLVAAGTYGHLLRMEARAQIRHAREMSAFPKLHTIQTSDEYDFGTIYFCRSLRRRRITILNAAHGISKYLPNHEYDEFDALTQEQISFYDNYNACRFRIRQLTPPPPNNAYESNVTTVVLLGQYSRNMSDLLKDAESQMLDIVTEVASRNKNVRFLYRKHPNNDSDVTLAKGIELSDGRLLAGNNVIQFSLYSTCQIDPNFVGCKFLVETKFIKPQFAYGSEEPIIQIDDLASHLANLLNHTERNL